MNKATTNVTNAFMAARAFRSSNDSVEFSPLGEVVVMKFHGHAIARRDVGSNQIEVTNAGYFTNTTKARLNGLPGVSVVQRNFTWYLNGVEWDGSWKLV